MESVFRSIAVYLILLAVLRLGGKRTLQDTTLFDFVLLLTIGEATQQALIGNDFSITNAIIIIVTLVSTDIVFSLLKQKFKGLDRVVDGVPIIVVEYGKTLRERMRKSRIDSEDILEAARTMHGLEFMHQIKFAILEKNGKISIIPYGEEDKAKVEIAS